MKSAGSFGWPRSDCCDPRSPCGGTCSATCRSARTLPASRNAVSRLGQLFSCSGVRRSAALIWAMRTSSRATIWFAVGAARSPRSRATAGLASGAAATMAAASSRAFFMALPSGDPSSHNHDYAPLTLVAVQECSQARDTTAHSAAAGVRTSQTDNAPAHRGS